MNKSLVPIFTITFLVFMFLAISSAPLSKFLLENYFSVKTNQDDWIGFAGNILGGILGGISTMLGVSFAFGLERKKSIREGIPNKILNLYIIKEKIDLHKFSRAFHISSTKQDSERNLTLFQNELNQFNLDKNDLLERASQIDTDVFSIMDNYYKSIRIIDLKLKKTLENKSSETQQSINQCISEAALFHTFLVEKAIKKIEEKTTKIVVEFHNQKKSKKLLAEIDNHTYLS
ncbi:hypothetical protein ABLO26_24330 [Neobacillus sp. 179-J 1A1 HS]|uniref:hypothetical protein n=1 Tax=Neobacillus driksii TaxID=3035913 RepID=UPI0035BC09CC